MPVMKCRAEWCTQTKGLEGFNKVPESMISTYTPEIGLDHTAEWGVFTERRLLNMIRCYTLGQEGTTELQGWLCVHETPSCLFHSSLKVWLQPDVRRADVLTQPCVTASQICSKIPDQQISEVHAPDVPAVMFTFKPLFSPGCLWLCEVERSVMHLAVNSFVHRLSKDFFFF